MGMDAWLTLALSAEIDLDALIVAVIKAAKCAPPTRKDRAPQRSPFHEYLTRAQLH